MIFPVASPGDNIDVAPAALNHPALGLAALGALACGIGLGMLLAFLNARRPWRGYRTCDACQGLGHVPTEALLDNRTAFRDVSAEFNAALSKDEAEKLGRNAP